MKRWLLVALLAASPPASAASLSTNPAKLFLGIPNLEAEFPWSGRFSARFFSEALMVRTIEHPDFLAKIGINAFADENQDGWYGSPNLGFTWSRSETPRPFLGLDLGYRHPFTEQFFGTTRALLHFHGLAQTPVFGAELLLGTRF